MFRVYINIFFAHGYIQLIPHLRSPDYFGQYGKITKIVVVKRSNPGSPTPVIGLYITYHRREDAARCIALVDGAPAPGEKPTDLLRASYGTTKYCMSFLRGVTCSDHACMNLHEWGDEKDCFTKEDLTTLYVQIICYMTCIAHCLQVSTA
jgi:CCR4-NOT transcription complex subunit 4